LLLLLSACSSAHYRQAADTQVYRAIQQYENQVFGHTNDFTINTRFSDRDPQLIPPTEIIADRQSTNTLAINLEEALDIAVEHSRDYQSQKERLYLSALALTSARHEFSPQFFGSVDGGISGDPNGDPTGFGGGQIGVNQLLSTGGRLSVALVNDFIGYYTGIPANRNRETAVSILSVNLVQPLLRGFGKNDPLVENLTQAERNVVYATRSYSLFQNQFAVDIVNDYFDILNRKVQVRNFYTNYLRRVETTQYIEARAVDRASANDVEDARSSELTARIQYVTAVAGYLDSLDTFKTRLGIPIGSQLYLDDEELRLMETAGAIPADVSREAAFDIAVDHQMDILNAIDQFEDSKRKIRIAADRLRPGLDFVGSVDLVESGTPDYTDVDINNLRYTVGLELDLPLDRLRERNEYRSVLIDFEVELRSLSLTLDQFKQRIDAGLRSMEEARLNILSQQDQLRVERRRVDMNTIRLEAGRVNLRDLREAQDALIAAQNALTQRIVDYQRTRLQLLIDIGVLDTARERFWLSDPLASLLTDEQRGVSPLQMPRDTLIPPSRWLDPKQ
jgi:outer membrane protein TolC